MKDQSNSAAPAPHAGLASSNRLVVRLRRVAWTILAVGWVYATLIYVYAGPDASPGVAEYATDGRVYDYNIERIGGKAALFAAQFNEWLSSLWHGRRLSVTVAVLCLAATLLCWWVAGLVSEQDAVQRAQDDPPE